MNAIINPMMMDTASNPGTAEFGVGFVVGAVWSISSFSCVDVTSGVGVERAFSPATPSDGVFTGVGVAAGVVDGADTDVDVASVPPSATVGESVVVAPPEVVNQPSLTVAGISL